MSGTKVLAAMVALAGAAMSAGAQDVLFDAGPVCTSLNVSTGLPTLLGLSSGNLASASLPQRWSASPFTLAAPATVTELHVYGFDPEDTGNTGTLFFSNLKYVIWNRTAFNAPTSVNQVASGTVATSVIGPGVDDPRSGFSNLMVFKVPVNHSLPAGNYYLTVYADGNSPTAVDANFAWFTNAQLNAALTPPNTPIFMTDATGMHGWRSSSFPSPGFARYTLAPSAWLPDPAPTQGPMPQDPNYMLNNAFFIIGTPGGTCYANCDGSTVEPVLNVSDFICFQTEYAAGSTYANCDGSTIEPVLNVSDFICFQTSYSAGCS